MDSEGSQDPIWGPWRMRARAEPAAALRQARDPTLQCLAVDAVGCSAGWGRVGAIDRVKPGSRALPERGASVPRLVPGCGESAVGGVKDGQSRGVSVNLTDGQKLGPRPYNVFIGKGYGYSSRPLRAKRPDVKVRRQTSDVGLAYIYTEGGVKALCTLGILYAI